MNTPARLLRGTGLTLGRVATAIIGQIATVPIYLSYWDARTYGIWLIMLGMLGYLSLFSTAYQQYTYAEVLKRGPDARNDVRRIYWASLAVGYLIAIAELVAILGLAPALVSAALPLNAGVATDSVILLLVLFGLLNMVTMPFGAITAQTMTIHGYYPHLAAWGLLRTASSLAAPAVAVVLGADFMTAGLVLIAAHALPAMLSFSYWVRLARRFGLLARQRIDWKMGSKNALYCLPLAGRTFIDSFRQQGFRILLGAYAGATTVTALATTRTFANVLHQGLTTITAPLMPELMRYVVNRDQERMEGSFAIVWLCIFAILVPGVLLLCLLAEPIFLFWTRGVVTFDPVLFLTLLAVVLVYAASQPAVAILQGQNRIAWLIATAVVAALALGLFALVLLPSFGLIGAGFALLAAEICAAAVAIAGATRSLRQSGLGFPHRSFAMVASNTGIGIGLALLCVTVFPAKPAIFAIPFALNLVFAGLYWATIPALARERILGVLAQLRMRLPGCARVDASTSA